MTLEPSDLNDAKAIGKQWIQTVATLAEEASEKKELPLRRFLATYHLGVIRDGALALPVVALLASQDELTKDDEYSAMWGAGLIDLARRYNSVARQQREPVFLSINNGQRVFDPLLDPPQRRWHPLLTVDDWWFTPRSA